jgi:hypothetical protein
MKAVAIDVPDCIGLSPQYSSVSEAAAALVSELEEHIKAKQLF